MADQPLIMVEVRHLCGCKRRYQKRKPLGWAQDLQLRRWKSEEAGKICRTCFTEANARTRLGAKLAKRSLHDRESSKE